MRDVIAWVEAGRAVDPARYHSATRDGVATDLGEDIAFVTPSGKTNCMTDAKYSEGALACLVDLTNPPPRPDDAYGQWKGGWIDYDGMSVKIGSVHGDPGRFTAGSGPELPYGQSLAFGDYRCRSDQAGLVCVKSAGVKYFALTSAGVMPAYLPITRRFRFTRGTFSARANGLMIPRWRSPSPTASRGQDGT